MKVAKRRIGAAGIVDVEGDVDMYTSPKLRQALQDYTRANVPRIIVNLAGVDFMDSSGIATMVQAFKEARSFGGEVRLAALGGNVMRVLKLSNLTALFPVYDSVEEAVS